MTWLSIGIIVSIFGSVGVISDRYMLIRHKTAFHSILIKWWNNLDGTAVPNIPQSMAISSLKQIKKLFPWPIMSWKFICVFIFSFWVIISLVAIFGQLATGILFVTSPIPLPIFTLYLAIFPFDVITIFITINALIVVSKGNTLKSIAAIIIDIMAALILLYFCFASSIVSTEYAFDNKLPGTSFGLNYFENVLVKHVTDEYEDVVITDDTIILVHRDYSENKYPYWFYYVIPDLTLILAKYVILDGKIYTYHYKSAITLINKDQTVTYYKDYINSVSIIDLLVAGTTFLPTFLYMIYLLILYVGKWTLMISRHLLLYYLEVATQYDPNKNPQEFAPGTLLSIVFSFVALLCKSIHEIIIYYN